MTKPTIEVSPWCCILMAAAVQLLPPGLPAAAVCAAFIHEGFHFAVLKCCKIPVSRILIGARGAQIQTGPLTPVEEILCAAAGPLGSLSLMIVSRWLPVLAFLGLAQGLFNLLPIYPLDGGRIVRAIIHLIRQR